MKLKIKAELFKEMVSKSVKGASCNKLIPLTGFIAISVKSKQLTLTTTDATNYLYIRTSGVDSKDFYAVVEADVFSKLISRMTCENIELEVAENTLKVNGNGNYTVEVPVDENGDMVKFPDPLSQIDAQPIGEVENVAISSILTTLKPSLATTLEIPCYTGYYVGNRIVATDTEIISTMDKQLLPDNYLISAEMMDLLSIMTAEKISVDAKDNILIFSTPDCVVYGPVMEGIEDYSIDAINGMLEQEFPNSCQVSKNSLLQLLDRIILFVGPYDDKAIDLAFIKDGLLVQSKSTSGSEIIPYIGKGECNEFACSIDIVYFRTQVKSQVSDTVEIHYGDSNVIKMVDGNITQMISLMQSEEDE